MDKQLSDAMGAGVTLGKLSKIGGGEELWTQGL